jgi:hypothetical protein
MCVDPEQPMLDLALFQERPPHELAKPLFEVWIWRGDFMKSNLVETANI